MSSEVPEGWREASFSHLARYENGRAFKPADWGTEGLPIVRIAQITNPEAEKDRYDGEVDNRHLLADGDLIFSWSATLAVMKWRQGPAVLNQHLFKVTPGADIDQDWLQFRLEASIPDLAEEAHGTTMKHIRKGTLASQTTLVPPLAEQRRIAEVLEAADRALRLAKATAEQSLRCLEATLATLTSGDGIAEVDWMEGRCDSFFVLQRGFDITESQATPGPYQVISSSGPSYTHSEAAVAAPAVITGRKGRLGAVFYSDRACWPHDTTLWVKDFMGNNPRFVFWKLRAMKLEALDAATSVPTLNRNNVHVLRVRFPSVRQQVEFAEILDALERAVRDQREQVRALEIMKAWLASDLLSGRVRVPA